MNSDSIALCSKEKFPFEISLTKIDKNENLIYLNPYETNSIIVYKILDQNPSLIQIKTLNKNCEIEKEKIKKLILSPNHSHLVCFNSNQTLYLYLNQQDHFQYLNQVSFFFFLF